MFLEILRDFSECYSSGEISNDRYDEISTLYILDAAEEFLRCKEGPIFTPVVFGREYGCEISVGQSIGEIDCAEIGTMRIPAC